MNVDSHLMELRRKHEMLSDEVAREQRSPGSSDLRISDLKKRKLRLKEEIARVAGEKGSVQNYL